MPPLKTGLRFIEELASTLKIKPKVPPKILSAEEAVARYGKGFEVPMKKVRGKLEPIISEKIKSSTKLGIGAIAGLGVLSQSDDTEAGPLSKSVRKVYKAMSEKGKVFYRIDQDIIEFMKGKRVSGYIPSQHEYPKPLGIFVTDKPKQLPWFANAFAYDRPPKSIRPLKNLIKTTDKSVQATSGKEKGITRIVVKPISENRILSINEADLEKSYYDFAEKGYSSKKFKVNREDIMNRVADEMGDTSGNEPVLNDLTRTWTKHLAKKYDMIHITDVWGTPGDEWVILNPNIIKGSFYRNTKKIVGAATALTATSGIFSDDAEAVKVPKGVLSSASKMLEGKMFQGKAISRIIKPNILNKWRYIIFEDGSSVPVEKDMLRSLASEYGTRRKLGEFNLKNNIGKMQQSKKSFDYHLRRSVNQPILGRDFIKTKRAKHLRNLTKAKISPTDQVQVVDKFKNIMYFPEDIVKRLEKKGLVKRSKEIE